MRSEPKLQVGDRVVLIDLEPCSNPDLPIGSTGVVCSIDRFIGVCWDQKIMCGHNCDSGHGAKCDLGYGWWVFESQLKQEDDIEIDEDRFISIICE